MNLQETAKKSIKKLFKLKTMNNEYYERIEYLEDDGGMFCLGWRSKFFGVIVRLSSHITGCRLDRWEDLMEYMVRVTGNS